LTVWTPDKHPDVWVPRYAGGRRGLKMRGVRNADRTPGGYALGDARMREAVAATRAEIDRRVAPLYPDHRLLAERLDGGLYAKPRAGRVLDTQHPQEPHVLENQRPPGREIVDGIAPDRLAPQETVDRRTRRARR
jgi:hypothetical protein